MITIDVKRSMHYFVANVNTTKYATELIHTNAYFYVYIYINDLRLSVRRKKIPEKKTLKCSNIIN